VVEPERVRLGTQYLAGRADVIFLTLFVYGPQQSGGLVQRDPFGLQTPQAGSEYVFTGGPLSDHRAVLSAFRFNPSSVVLRQGRHRALRFDDVRRRPRCLYTNRRHVPSASQSSGRPLRNNSILGNYLGGTSGRDLQLHESGAQWIAHRGSRPDRPSFCPVRKWSSPAANVHVSGARIR